MGIDAPWIAKHLPFTLDHSSTIWMRINVKPLEHLTMRKTTATRSSRYDFEHVTRKKKPPLIFLSSLFHGLNTNSYKVRIVFSTDGFMTIIYFNFTLSETKN